MSDLEQVDDGDAMSLADYYRSLRLLIEQDVEGGLQFAPRLDTPAPKASVLVASASAKADRVPAPAPVLKDQPAAPLIPDLVFPPATSAAARLQYVSDLVAVCSRCKLCKTRQHTVPGEGAAHAELVFIGEGPGADEDASGRPFVGAAGQLLDRMIEAMGLQRSEVHIINAVKCRPPNNRNPEPDELAACYPYLQEQLQAIAPKVICSLGAVALRVLVEDDKAGISRNRGKELSWKGTPLVATFHPSYLLRNPSSKADAWTDLKRVVSLLGRSLPQRPAGS